MNISLSNVPLAGQSAGVTWIVNTSAINQVWRSLLDTFSEMYIRKAFVHK